MFSIFYQLGSVFSLIWCHFSFHFARENKLKGYSSFSPFSLHFIKVIHKRQVEKKKRGQIQSNQGRIKLELYIRHDLPYRGVIHCSVIYVVVLFCFFNSPWAKQVCSNISRQANILSLSWAPGVDWQTVTRCDSSQHLDGLAEHAALFTWAGSLCHKDTQCEGSPAPQTENDTMESWLAQSSGLKGCFCSAGLVNCKSHRLAPHAR